MKATTIKHFLFALLLLMLVLPFVQQQVNIPKIKALKGYFVLPKKPVLSKTNLLNGSYQDSLNKYLEQHIGYRADLVRLHNQFKYTFFDTLNAAGVIQGKNGYLFELNYIKAYYGLDYVGDDTLTKHIQQTVAVNNWLKKQKKHLIVVLAPGKGSFFPEYLPDGYVPETKQTTNETAYFQELNKVGIPVISGNRLFSSVKDSCRFELFPQCGIHWSYYGMGLVFDSVLRTMNRLNGKQFIDFGIKSIETTGKLRSPDRDLWEGLNIIRRPDDKPMPYPEFTFDKKTPDSMPSVIVVADSYYWQWYGSGYATRAFGKHDFWYYNKQIIPGDGSGAINKTDIDLMTRVLEADFIILLQTDANMSRYSFGFIPELYNAIQQHADWDEDALSEIQATIARIRNSPSYMEMIREKAKKRNISIDEMIRIDANWVYENKRKEAEKK